ncbi:hypothetical protein K438DRAFT_1990540 [Mycena galopus ATCC 62051]|nr:hypothetical protein K438DRAFT_1990540 [Mycena galopus ATCC 62051]
MPVAPVPGQDIDSEMENTPKTSTHPSHPRHQVRDDALVHDAETVPRMTPLLDFGQVGGIVLVTSPQYLFTTLESSHYEACARRSYKSMSKMMIKNSFIKTKGTFPYGPNLEVPVLLNSLAKASLDIKTAYKYYTMPLTSAVPMPMTSVAAISETTQKAGQPRPHHRACYRLFLASSPMFHCYAFQRASSLYAQELLKTLATQFFRILRLQDP